LPSQAGTVMHQSTDLTHEVTQIAALGKHNDRIAA
jgi:hypothetical protein